MQIIGGIFCKNRRITSDTMDDEEDPIQLSTKKKDIIVVITCKMVVLFL